MIVHLYNQQCLRRDTKTRYRLTSKREASNAYIQYPSTHNCNIVWIEVIVYISPLLSCTDSRYIFCGIVSHTIEQRHIN